MKTLYVHEIFSSINGEICKNHQGSLCTFVRLQGCNLRCSYCDTVKAQKISFLRANTEMTIKEVSKEIERQRNMNVTITGGEPLLQQTCLEYLLEEIGAFDVSIETNGSIALPKHFPWSRVNWVVDYKLPGSGEHRKMCEKAFVNLNNKSIVKFVVGSKEDFHFAVRKTKKILRSCLGTQPVIAFSACTDTMPPEKLVSLMDSVSFLKEIGAVLSLQLHKIIGVS